MDGSIKIPRGPPNKLNVRRRCFEPYAPPNARDADYNARSCDQRGPTRPMLKTDSSEQYYKVNRDVRLARRNVPFGIRRDAVSGKRDRDQEQRHEGDLYP